MINKKPLSKRLCAVYEYELNKKGIEFNSFHEGKNYYIYTIKPYKEKQIKVLSKTQLAIIDTIKADINHLIEERDLKENYWIKCLIYDISRLNEK